MKSAIKSILRKIGHGFDLNNPDMLKLQTDAKVAQVLLQQSFRAQARDAAAEPPTFKEVGFRQYSEFEEDGILLYLFSLIRPKTRTCVEICAGDGTECNTANLIINHGWWGHLFDGQEKNVRRATAFYGSHRDTLLHPPRCNHAWVTAENVNELIADSGATGPIDLLSLDLDGMEYWIWNAITAVDPTVVVCEIQNTIPPDLSLTVPYDPKFCLSSFEDDFRGASLRALAKLGRAKGYRLVGVNRLGFNAFFVKAGLVDKLLPEVAPEDCAGDPYTQLAQRTRWPKVKDKPWLRI